MHEDGAQGDVLLLHAAVREEEDALLMLEGGGTHHLRAPEDVACNNPSALAEDVVLDGVENVLTSA
eukprot:5480255-Alexandrium_andersonii.AAC.1